MKGLENMKIDLKGISDAAATFEWDLRKDYFEAIEATEVRDGELHAALEVRKTAGVYELDLHVDGEATVTCDVCLDDMRQPVDTDSHFVVRLGDSYSDDDVITVPAEEGELDMSWLIYEQIVLAIPTRHVHEEGGCNPDMLARIGQMKAPESTAEEDPRWSELRKLKSTINE